MIYFITLVAAFCSLCYELALAQTLASIMGNTVVRYNITMGIYVAALGVGAYFANYRIKSVTRRLIITEYALSVIGFASPALLIAADHFMRHHASALGLDTSSGFGQTATFLVNHFFILVVGLLSGVELPLLMSMGKQEQKVSGIKVLGVDYIGSLIASIVFPLLMINNMGVLTSAYFVAILNLCIATYLSLRYSAMQRNVKLAVHATTAMLFAATCFYFKVWNRIIIEKLWMS